MATTRALMQAARPSALRRSLHTSASGLLLLLRPLPGVLRALAQVPEPARGSDRSESRSRCRPISLPLPACRELSALARYMRLDGLGLLAPKDER